jgi:hypothetical protein
MPKHGQRRISSENETKENIATCARQRPTFMAFGEIFSSNMLNASLQRPKGKPVGISGIAREIFKHLENKDEYVARL